MKSRNRFLSLNTGFGLNKSYKNTQSEQTHSEGSGGAPRVTGRSSSTSRISSAPSRASATALDRGNRSGLCLYSFPFPLRFSPFLMGKSPFSAAAYAARKLNRLSRLHPGRCSPHSSASSLINSSAPRIDYFTHTYFPPIPFIYLL